MSRYSKVSVIIPTLNDACIGTAIASALANRPPLPFEVLVAGRDDARRIPHEGQVRFIETEKPCLPSFSRNLAAQQAGGDLFLFMDSDCVADPDWIGKAVQALGTDWHVAGGGIRFPEGNRWDLGDNLAVFNPFHVSRKPREIFAYLGSNNLAVSRAAFEAVGGFDTRRWVGEDWEMLNRLRAKGYRTFFDPSFSVLHQSGRNSRARVIEHAASYGKGMIEMLRHGNETGSRLRADRLARFPFAAAAWSAARATLQTARVFLPHPAFWKYAGCLDVVWLFYYARRRTIFSLLALETGG